MDKTPLALGYRMPAEWEPHTGVWLTWPRPNGISFPERYSAIPQVYAELIRKLIRVEDVNINVWDAEMEHLAHEHLNCHGIPRERISFHYFPAYEPWCRDHGPIFISRDNNGIHERAIVNWNYNAWGDKYPPYDLDNAVPQKIAQLRGLPIFTPDMVLEGGSIDVNGQGLLLTTEACLLNPNRNPHLNKSEIEDHLKQYLGVSQVLWLGDGIVGDDTDGHIDDLARFIGPNTVVTVVEEDIADENYSILQDNLHRLRAFRNLEGRPLEIIELPTPGYVQHAGQRLPASYANFYLANESLILPTFHKPNDQLALQILSQALPERRIIGIDSTDLIWGLGSFHCITQQEPA
jgi:agmatine deiminase